VDKRPDRQPVDNFHTWSVAGARVGARLADRPPAGSTKGTSMTRYEVDSAQVIQAGAAVQASAQQIGDEVDRMMRHLLDLQGSWRGQAATSFQGVIGDWRATQERVRASLEDIQRALALAGRQYAEVESTTAAMFST
jgi:WXG100 family type VII secretion target